MITHRPWKSGFTMIEILVVIVILGILASIASINIRISLIKSRDAVRKIDLESIQKALELYQNDHGVYPVADGSNMTDDSDNPIPWGEEFSDSNGTVYMSKLPADPKVNPDYCYLPADPPTSYQLYANLENSNDPGCITPNCGSLITCGSYGYNYGVSSTDVLP